MSHATVLSEVTRVYEGSNGDATKALYERLAALGPCGAVALNLFRAHKNSGRAKVYRGRRYRDAAYDRKQWALDNLSAILVGQGAMAGFAAGTGWGWSEDPDQPAHRWVLYVETPHGQLSFHTAARGVGPDFAGAWDGVRDAGAGRICRWVADLLASEQSPQGQ